MLSGATDSKEVRLFVNLGVTFFPVAVAHLIALILTR